MQTFINNVSFENIPSAISLHYQDAFPFHFMITMFEDGTENCILEPREPMSED